MFSRPEAIRYSSGQSPGKAAKAAAAADRHAYTPLRYVSSRLVSALELLDHIEGHDIRRPIDVVLEVSDAAGGSHRLAVPEPLLLYTLEPGHGNAKVCRNAHGDWVGGQCIYRWYLRSMCFSVVEQQQTRAVAAPAESVPPPPVSAAAWEFDPETPGNGRCILARAVSRSAPTRHTI